MYTLCHIREDDGIFFFKTFKEFKPINQDPDGNINLLRHLDFHKAEKASLWTENDAAKCLERDLTVNILKDQRTNCLNQHNQLP